MDWAGDSLPFGFLARVADGVKTIDAATLRCAHVGVGRASASEQPRFRGIEP
jgi:hypothetical protein